MNTKTKSYYDLYIKYKTKYIKLKEIQNGGAEEFKEDEVLSIENTTTGSCWNIASQIILLHGDSTRDLFHENAEKDCPEIYVESKDLLKQLLPFNLIDHDGEIRPDIIPHIYEFINIVKDRIRITRTHIKTESSRCETAFANAYFRIFDKRQLRTGVYGGDVSGSDVFFLLNLLSILFLKKFIRFTFYNLEGPIDIDLANSSMGSIINKKLHGVGDESGHVMGFYKYFDCPKFVDNDIIMNFNWINYFTMFNANYSQGYNMYFDQGSLSQPFLNNSTNNKLYNDELECRGKTTGKNLPRPNSAQIGSITLLHDIIIEAVNTEEINKFKNEHMRYYFFYFLLNHRELFVRFIVENGLLNSKIVDWDGEEKYILFILIGISDTRDLIIELLSHNPNINIISNNGNSLLMVSILMNEPGHVIFDEIIRIMRQSGSDINSIINHQDSNGLNAIDCALSDKITDNYYLNKLMDFTPMITITPRNFILALGKKREYAIQMLRDNITLINSVYEKYHALKLMVDNKMVDVVDVICEINPQIFKENIEIIQTYSWSKPEIIQYPAYIYAYLYDRVEMSLRMLKCLPELINLNDKWGMNLIDYILINDKYHTYIPEILNYIKDLNPNKPIQGSESLLMFSIRNKIDVVTNKILETPEKIDLNITYGNDNLLIYAKNANNFDLFSRLTSFYPDGSPIIFKTLEYFFSTSSRIPDEYYNQILNKLEGKNPVDIIPFLTNASKQLFTSYYLKNKEKIPTDVNVLNLILEYIYNNVQEMYLYLTKEQHIQPNVKTLFLAMRNYKLSFEIVKELLDSAVAKGFDINMQDENGDTLLIIATRLRNSPDRVDIILQHDPDLNIKNNKGQNAMNMLGMDYSSPTYKLLSGFLPPEYRNANKLYEELNKSQVDMREIKRLMCSPKLSFSPRENEYDRNNKINQVFQQTFAKCDINIVEKMMTLMYSSEYVSVDHYIETGIFMRNKIDNVTYFGINHLIKKYIEKNSDISIYFLLDKLINNWTNFHDVIIDIIEKRPGILNYTINGDYYRNDKNTLLIKILENPIITNKTEIFTELLKFNPDLSIKNKAGNSILFACIDTTENEVYDMLLNKVPNLNTLVNSQGNTLLHEAIEKNKIELMRKILSINPEIINVPNPRNGIYPFMLALNSNYDIALELIRNYTPNLMITSYQLSPLILTLIFYKKGNTQYGDIITELMTRDIDVQVVDSKGNNAFDYAIELKASKLAIAILGKINSLTLQEKQKYLRKLSQSLFKPEKINEITIIINSK